MNKKSKKNYEPTTYIKGVPRTDHWDYINKGTSPKNNPRKKYELLFDSELNFSTSDLFTKE